MIILGYNMKCLVCSLNFHFITLQKCYQKFEEKTNQHCKKLCLQNALQTLNDSRKK